MNPPRKPDFVLKIKSADKNDKDSTRAGVAWLNPDGHINIKLNPGIVLGYRDGLIYNLFPNNEPDRPPTY